MDLTSLSVILKENGVVGAGGAGFPSYAKLSGKADTIILNCAECEPLLKLHRQVLQMHTFEVLSGLKEAADAVGAERVIVAVKNEYKETLCALRTQIGDFNGFEIKTLDSVYPAGDEIVLIYETTGRVVDAGAIPITKGVIVFNVETALNIYNAVYEKMPVIYKYVTVAGEVKKPMTYKVLIGTSLSYLLQMSGGVSTDSPAYILGGPMMGRECLLSESVTKTTNALIVLDEKSMPVRAKRADTSIMEKRTAASCCQCRTCTDLCPRHLLGHPIKPHMFMRSVSSGKCDTASAINALYCSGCSLCEMYSCPQGLSPKALIAKFKAEYRMGGGRIEICKAEGAESARKLKRVSVSRLTARMGLSKYNVSAPTDENEIGSPELKIPLLQHIGKPSAPAVKTGDLVKKGQIIASADENSLGVCIHSPADGKVMAVNEKFITIRRG